MRKIMMMAMAGIAALGATGAQAQGRYDGNDGNRGGYGDYNRSAGNGYGRMAQNVCSGRRAHGLEAELNARVRDGDIDPRYARQIHRQIDTYEAYQRTACQRGDIRSIQGFDARYDMLQDRIEQGSRDDGGYRR